MITAKNQSHFMLIIVCLLCDIFIRPFYTSAQFNAKTSIVGAMLSFLIFAIIAALFLNMSNPLSSPIIKKCLFVLFVATSATTIVKANQYYRFISAKELPLLAFAGVFIAVIVYASKMPQNALSRAAFAVTLLCILSVLLIIVSNFKDLDMQKLQVSYNGSISKSMLYHFNFSSEILLFYVLTSKKNAKRNDFTLALTVVVVIYCVLTLLAEAVMGDMSIMQAQPFNNLSRMGSISVFKRLDAVFSAIWVLGMLIKSIAFYVNGISLIQSKSIGKEIASLTLLIVLIFIAYSVDQIIIKSVLSIFTIILVISICIISALEKRRAYEKSY